MTATTVLNVVNIVIIFGFAKTVIIAKTATTANSALIAGIVSTV